MAAPAAQTSMEASAPSEANSGVAGSRSVFSIDRPLLWAVLTALAVRLVVVGFLYPRFLDPDRDYWQFGYEAGKIARSIDLGHGFGNPYYGGDTGPTAILPPVFPYLLAGAMALFGIYTKASALAIMSLNSLFSALTCIPIFYSARKSFGSGEARWAAWAWALFPYAIYFSTDWMWYHTLVALLLSCILWASLQLQESTHIRAWAGFGVLSGLGALTDPVVLGVVPLLGAWACFQLRRKRRPWMFPAVTAAFALCAVMAPWLVRNYRVFHRPVFLRDGFPLQVVIGNAGETLHWWNGSETPSSNAEEMAKFRRVGELAYMNGKWPRVFALIRNNPLDIAWRSVRRFVYMWTAYWSLGKDYLWDEPLGPANVPFCTALTVLALIGLRRTLRRDAGGAVPYGLVLAAFPLVYYLTIPALRYRHPMDPEIVILACCAIGFWRTQSRAVANSPRLAKAHTSSAAGV